MSDLAEQTKPALSYKQQRLRARRIARQKKEEADRRKALGLPPPPPPVRAASPKREEYIQPAPADGENVIHEQGKTGRPIAVRLDAIGKLRREGKLTVEQERAGELYLAIVQGYFLSSSGMFKAEVEATGQMRNADPIRLYNKGRRTYVSTQKPRIIATPRTSFDGWSGAKSDAMDALARVKRALRRVDGDALRALYALVIHPTQPEKRSVTLRIYVMREYGYQNQRSQDEITQRLCRALNALWKELGEATQYGKAA